MNAIGRELLARRLGDVLLEHLEGLEPERLSMEINSEAADILADIRGILDNTALDDFGCMEEIVSLLNRKGIVTSRHDFG